MFGSIVIIGVLSVSDNEHLMWSMTEQISVQVDLWHVHST